MASLRPSLRLGDRNKDRQGKYNVKIRLSHKSKTRYISTSYYVFENQFDIDAGRVVTHPNARAINMKLHIIMAEYEKILIMEEKRLYRMDIQQVLSLLKKKSDAGLNFISFTDDLVKDMDKVGRRASAESYRSMLTRLGEFHKGTLNFEDITPKFLRDFEGYMIKAGNKINAIGVYMRNIRAVFNLAINDGIIDLGLYPFRAYKIKTEKTRKRNVPAEKMKELITTNFPKKESIARDVFLLQFYLIGINFKDLTELKEITMGRIEYGRSKTGGLFSVKVWPEAEVIINRYKGEEFLLDISEISAANNYRWVMKQVNDYLENVSKVLKIPKITTNSARHTWATIARSIGIHKDDISLCLGHHTGGVTDYYIEENMGRIDQLNRMVIDAILNLL